MVLPLSPLTEKDRADLAFAVEQGVEWIALSFVQRPEDIHEARDLIKGRAAVMLKMEKPAAVEHLEELVELSDAIMVARGDLGVELSLPELPALQKRMITESRRQGRPVIVATQMLESMISAPVPTRAEVSDVATAVYEGADCVMLSAESAAGQYPVEAVSFMDDIIRHVERDPGYRQVLDATQAEWGKTIGDAMTKAAYQTALAVDAAAIVAYTLSGTTGLRAARERPPMPILGITNPRRHRPPSRPLLWRACGECGRGHPFLRRDGGPRGAGGRGAAAGRTRRPARDHGRRALRQARHHEHPAGHHHRGHRPAVEVRHGRCDRNLKHAGASARPPWSIKPAPRAA